MYYEDLLRERNINKLFFIIINIGINIINIYKNFKFSRLNHALFGAIIIDYYLVW